MTAFHVVLGTALIAVNLAAGLYGGWRWWRQAPSRAFWVALRIGQALVAVEAAQGLVLILMGRDLPPLHLIYGLVPLGVAFLAEQLRLVSAQTVLDARGIGSAAEVGTLPDDEQRAIVLAVLRREMGIMAISAVVVALLGVRAAGGL
jgi:hypothetical protein